MKNSKYIFLLVLCLLVVPFCVNADQTSKNNTEKDYIIVGETTKYMKTVNTYNNVVKDEYGNIISANLLNSDSVEITKEELDKVDLSNTIVETRDSTTIETIYRRMTTDLEYVNGAYRYRNQVNWLNFPSVRSYDVIGIGHYSNVSMDGTPYFKMEYTTVSGIHYNSFFYLNQSFSNGDSATFLLPLPNLSNLKITYYYSVKKNNPANTITSQAIFGDYAHGIDSSLTTSQAENHYVNQNSGIVFNSSVYNKFDTNDEADVYWSGTW